MKVLVTEFISLDGVVQAPGAASEDQEGGFEQGGWTTNYFDPVVMGGMYDELAARVTLCCKDGARIRCRPRRGPVARGIADPAHGLGPVLGSPSLEPIEGPGQVAASPTESQARRS